MIIDVREVFKLKKNYKIDTEKMDFEIFKNDCDRHDREILKSANNWDEFLLLIESGNVDFEIIDFVMSNSPYEINEEWSDEESYIQVYDEKLIK